MTLLIGSSTVGIICMLLIFDGSSEGFLKVLAILAGCLSSLSVLILIGKVIFDCKEIVGGVRARTVVQMSTVEIANSVMIEDL